MHVLYFAGKIDYTDVKNNKKLLAFKIAHVGAEEFFNQVRFHDGNAVSILLLIFLL